MTDTPSSAAPDEKQPLFKRLAMLIRGDNSATAMRESLEEVIEESDRQTTELSPPERTMLANLLNFGDLKAGDVMVPRADIIAVQEDTPLLALVELFREAQHSRLPVYRDTLDDPVGLVHVKDVLALMLPVSGTTDAWQYTLSPQGIESIRREILFVPPSMPALDLLLKMQASHIHLALVIDEYGGTDGLVSIEDIIEEIVGDIADEHDEQETGVRDTGDGFIADARLALEDFAEATGYDLALDEDEDIDTLGGLAASLLGRVPQRGEIIAHPSGAEIEVLDADPRRVRRLKLRMPPRPGDAPVAPG